MLMYPAIEQKTVLSIVSLTGLGPEPGKDNTAVSAEKILSSFLCALAKLLSCNNPSTFSQMGYS